LIDAPLFVVDEFAKLALPVDTELPLAVDCAGLESD